MYRRGLLRMLPNHGLDRRQYGLRIRIVVTRKIECLSLTKISVYPQDTKVHSVQTARINRSTIRSKYVNHRSLRDALMCT
jgi:hypothetical protein